MKTIGEQLRSIQRQLRTVLEEIDEMKQSSLCVKRKNNFDEGLCSEYQHEIEIRSNIKPLSRCSVTKNLTLCGGLLQQCECPVEHEKLLRASCPF